jgi:hypothetical protein
MKSVLYEAELVRNTERRFGSTLVYHPVLLIRKDGTEAGLMFTADDVAAAELRAGSNEEDMPEPARRLAWLPWTVTGLVIAAVLLFVVY